MCWKSKLCSLSRGFLASVIGLGAVIALICLLSAGAKVKAVNPSILQDADRRTWAGSDSSRAQLLPHVGYGLNVRDPAHLDPLFAPLGFEWVKLYEQYDALPVVRLPYKVLYRIQLDGLPSDLSTWGAHVADIARAGRGLVEAYEIGNEPNQSWQWGEQVPDPDEFAAALRVAFARIKAVDPDVAVVSGGLGPVGRIQATPDGEGWPGNNGRSMDEWEFARIMFSQCVTGCFDVFGYHPFGFASFPETPPDAVANNFAFRGAEDLRQIMLAYDMGDRPMWATEFGWIRDPDADGLGWCKLVADFNNNFGWMLVDELDQADYISRAFAYADAHWPWMEAMFVWNLDWYDQGWTCDNIRFFSLRYVSGEAAPAYEALASMDKRPGPVGCRLRVDSAQRVHLADVDQPEIVAGSVRFDYFEGCDTITWTASLAPTSTLHPALPITQGQLGQALTFTVDTGALVTEETGATLVYPTGTYTALLTFTTTPSDIVGSPQTTLIVLVVASEVYRSYLPVVIGDP